MDTEQELCFVWHLDNFGANARNTIVEFCGGNVTKLSILPSKDLDKTVEKLHKSLANLPANRGWGRLHAQNTYLPQ